MTDARAMELLIEITKLRKVSIELSRESVRSGTRKSSQLSLMAKMRLIKAIDDAARELGI